ncbi:MAG: hypothetical protein ACRD4M_10915 [Candidatus Acidiferrales bacterium]
MTDSTYMASIYRLQAVNFSQSAKRLNASFGWDLDLSPASIDSLPFYFLISHTTELLLKSALLKRGFSENDLKKFVYGHNLIALLEKLQGKGVSVTSESAILIRGLNSQHQNHALRYTALVDDGQKTYMPPPALVFAMLDELLLLTRISTQGV